MHRGITCTLKFEKHCSGAHVLHHFTAAGPGCPFAVSLQETGIDARYVAAFCEVTLMAVLHREEFTLWDEVGD